MEQNSLSYATVDCVELIDDTTSLVDLTISSSSHTFFVSTNGEEWIQTHNSDMPDIDSDFSNRDLLVEDLRTEFGDDNVLYISNFNGLKLKSVVKDVSKFFGISFDEVNNVTKIVERQVKAAIQKPGDDKNLFELKFEDAMEHSEDFREFMENHPDVAEVVPQLVGQPKSIGRHAGGILLLEDAKKIMPVIKVRDNLQSPWPEGLTLKTLERLGYLKIDALGLDTLRIIQRCIEKIIQNQYGKLLELCIEKEKVKVYENQGVMLETGEYKIAKDLTFDDDIKIPIQLQDLQ